MIRRKILLTIFTLPAFIFGFLSINKLTTVYSATESVDECSAVLDLDRRKIGDNRFEVINNSSSCGYTLTLALYDSPQVPESNGWVEAQKLIGSDTQTIKPGETVEFFVKDAGKECFRQADLFEGSVALEVPLYISNLETSVYEVSCITPAVTNALTPTPTLTPTPSPTIIPTPTSGPAPTNTPAPGPTSTPAPGPTSTPTPAKGEVLALTGNTASIYAVIIAGAISLISGLILKKVSK